MARKPHNALGNKNHVVLADNWAEPYVIDELAVDRKKVEEISSWLIRHRERCGILLLTGPTGSCKTTVVKCLARSLDFELREWVTPLDRDYLSEIELGVYQSQAEKFEDFLYSCSRYRDLLVQSVNTASLLLVEDYPNIFLKSPAIFHKVLGRYRETARAPIVFICTDVVDQNINIASDLFPTFLQTNLGLSHVSLNPVTKTKMMFALKRMSAILKSISPGFRLPPQDVLTEICESSNGDVRYAMLSLQMKPQEDIVSIFDLAEKKGQAKKAGYSKKQTAEEEVISACGKDDRVGILHAVGRVLYPKWQSRKEKLLNRNVKRKRKADDLLLNASTAGVEWVHDPVSISDAYLSSASTFLLFVQENYPKTFSNIESAAAAALSLSEAEMLMNLEGVEFNHSISFDIGVRGVMVHNKTPSRSWNPINGPRCFDVAKIQREMSQMAESLFPLYPVSHVVFMSEILPYMSLSCRDTLSTDQRSFAVQISSMEPSAHFCETFKTHKDTIREKKLDKATFFMNPMKQPPGEQDDELHISEDDTDEELDEGAENLTMLEAAMNEEFDEGAENLTLLEAAISEEEQKDLNYSDLLNNSDDDEILSQL